MWHSWIPAAESGIVFQGDFCLTGKTKVLRRKRRLFASTHFLTSKKRVGPAVHEEKTGCACSCEDQGGQGKPAGEKSMRAQTLKEWNMMDV